MDTLDVWIDAAERLRGMLDGGVELEWPGNITVLVTPDTMLVYGPANETINADVNRLVGDMWQPDESQLPECLVTDVPSDTTDVGLIVEAIYASVRQYTGIAACGHRFERHSDEMWGRYCSDCHRLCGDACCVGDPVFAGESQP